MKLLLSDGLVFFSSQSKRTNILIENGKISKIADKIDCAPDKEINLNGHAVIPGAIDVHAHLREPGYSHKETILGATKGAAKGGVTTVLAMPNLIPVPDSRLNLSIEMSAIKKSAVIKVYPMASITINQKGRELSDIEGLSPLVKGFSDDGKGVEDLNLLKEAMIRVKEADNIISSHAEALGYGFSPEAEYIAVERELELAKKTGVRYHFCHLSTKKSFELVKQAKQSGVDVTCEVTPHHLFLNEKDIKNANYKMNPPLRSEADMEAAVEALLCGVADMIATDHAPHSKEEKAMPYDIAPCGIIGFETMFALLTSKLLLKKLCTMEDIIRWTSINPAKRFRLPDPELKEGADADITVLNLDKTREYTIDEIASCAKNSPFIGEKLSGFPVLTLRGGETVYNAKEELWQKDC